MIPLELRGSALFFGLITGMRLPAALGRDMTPLTTELAEGVQRVGLTAPAREYCEPKDVYRLVVGVF